MKKIKLYLKRLGIALYGLFAMALTMFAGCATAMPTRTPPLAKEMGYDIPNWKGWTLVMLNQTVYKMETFKLELLARSMDLVNKPALELHSQAMDWLSMAATGSATIGIPLAWRHQPRKKKEEEE